MNFFKSSVIVLTLLSLSSCKWFSKDNMDCDSCCSSSHDTVLLTINGKPALTQQEFDSTINDIIEANEQAKLMFQLIPDFREHFFKQRKQLLIIREWAKRNGVQNTPEYKKKERKIIEAIKEQLNSEEFLKRMSVDVSDEDALKYYEENKDKDPRIAGEASGVRAVGVSFADNAKANEFAKKVKNAAGKLEAAAKDNKLAVTSFGTVTHDSIIDNAIKAKVLAAKHFPDTVVVKDSKGKTWVVVAKNKEKGTYKKFEEVKDTIKHMLKPKHMEDQLNKELDKLEKEYNVVENKHYFEHLRKQAEQNQAAQMQGMAQPEAPTAPAKELSGSKAA